GQLWEELAGGAPATPAAPSAPATPAALLERLATWRATLADYLGQLAIFGRAYAPPHVLGGIREARREIERLKGQIRTMGVAVAEHPDDVG
ncbi:MAG: hypothetical protein HGA45_27235, partial [Chloroflexales bacterium]|nr:hypothetical protein [Chloroflexales bacterium]